MSVETITLHGGRRHGETLAIPGKGDHDDLAIDLVVVDPRTKVRGMRQGHYTRVHNVSGNPTHEFEWAGFTTPFVPMESETSA